MRWHHALLVGLSLLGVVAAQAQLAKPDGTVSTTTSPTECGAGQAMTYSAGTFGCQTTDPWTYVKLAANTSTGSATAQNVATMAFTPVAATTYEVEGVLLVRTATATVYPRMGLGWPTVADGGAMIEGSGATATAAFLVAAGNPNTALLLPVGDLLNTTQSWPVTLRAFFGVGTGTSGNFRLQLASETAGTDVTIMKGSFFRYRTF